MVVDGMWLVEKLHKGYSTDEKGPGARNMCLKHDCPPETTL